MESKINKLNALGGAISAWSKIAFTVILIIGYGFITYFQIKANAQGISELKILMQDQNTLDSRELEVFSQRSDKRYTRAMREAERLNEINLRQNELLIDLIERTAFLEGVNSVK